MKNLSLILIFVFSTLLLQAKKPVKPIMVKVKGGTFSLGSNGKGSEKDEKPVHSITLSDFSIGKYEVTVGEYKAYCKATGHSMPKTAKWGWDNDKYPVVNVSYDDGAAYCAWLSKETRKNFRMPTEAEWEYAALGGQKSKGTTYAGGPDVSVLCWYGKNSDGHPHEVGTMKPNELGLYDMSGNLWEWCSDWYDGAFYAASPAVNPTGPTTGLKRVLRGGSWDDALADTRVADRNMHSPVDGGNNDYGFRVVLVK